MHHSNHLHLCCGASNPMWLFERGTKIMYDLLFKSRDEHIPVTVNIYDLLDCLEGSVDVGYDDDWITDMFIEKLNDISTMVWLLPSILHNGLKCPLNVVYEYGIFKMGNGHHRLVLALLCGIEEIQVIVSTSSCDFKNSEIQGVEQDEDYYWIDYDSDAMIFYEIIDDINNSRVTDDDDDDYEDDEPTCTCPHCSNYRAAQREQEFANA